MPSYQFAPARIQYGTGPAEDDFEVVEATPFIKQTQGTAYYFRVYFVVGTLSNVTPLANRLSSSAARGLAVFTEDMADRKPIYTQTEATGQTVLTTVPQSGQTPAFYTYAEPIGNSLPLFVLRATDSGRLRLSTNPCELCTAMHTPHGIAHKPYDGKVEYVGLLGFVLPSKFVKSKTLRYQKMLAVVTDRSFFPKNRANRKLRVVVGNDKSHR
jgi:hypothetical protein